MTAPGVSQVPTSRTFSESAGATPTSSKPKQTAARAILIFPSYLAITTLVTLDASRFPLDA